MSLRSSATLLIRQSVVSGVLLIASVLIDVSTAHNYTLPFAVCLSITYVAWEQYKYQMQKRYLTLHRDSFRLSGRDSEKVELQSPHTTRQLGLALLVVGAPNSGRSIFSHQLLNLLKKRYPQIHLHRATWDGERNWNSMLPEGVSVEDRERFNAVRGKSLAEKYFSNHKQMILKLREFQQLTIVEAGGIVQPEKKPLVEACTHCLIIASKPEESEAWRNFFHAHGALKLIGVIKSVASSGISDALGETLVTALSE